MSYHQEMIDYGQGRPVKVFLHKIEYVPTHWHGSVEVLFVVRGEVRITVENKAYRLQPEDIVVINANQLHELAGEGCVLAAIQFELRPFLEIAGVEAAAFHCVSAGHPEETRFLALKRLVAKIVYLATHYPDRMHLQIFGETCRLIEELLHHFRAPVENRPNPTIKYQERLDDIVAYIDSHYMEVCSLGDIAAHQHLTPSYLSAFFEKNMGVNLSSYLTKVRLGHAVRDLLNTDLTVEQVAAQSGFPNPRSFVNSFRREYGQLPSRYRKHYCEARPTSPAQIPANGYQLLDYNDSLVSLAKYLPRSGAGELPEKGRSTRLSTACVDTHRPGQALSHTFRTFTSVGSAREILYGDTQAMLRQLQQEVGFTYIKFHGIFDDSLMVYDLDSRGNPKYVFTNVDKVIDFLLSINLRPLIQFSFLPQALAGEDGRQLFYHKGSGYIGTPRSMEEWKNLVKVFLLHMLNRYGRREVESWPYTVWNEPDSPPRLFGIPLEAFDELYRVTYHTTKALLPGARFGSPSFMNVNEPEYLEHFLGQCAQNACPPDFSIIHFYPVVSSGSDRPVDLTLHTPVSLSTDPDLFRKYIAKVRRMLPQNRGEKIYLTEWNSTTSHRDLLNDTCYKAAYVVKCVCENYDDLDSFGYWCLSDGIEELRIEQELFHGGLGLYTINGVKKPAWYAFSFLSQLGDELVERNEGYFITRDSDRLQILLYNYHHFKDIYAKGVLFDVTSDNRYAAFIDNEQLELELMLERLEEDACYSVTEQFVNREHGSCYDSWLRMGAQPLDNPKEVEALKALSAPGFSKRIGKSENHVLHYSATLEPHEIRLVTIEKVNSGGEWRDV